MPALPPGYVLSVPPGIDEQHRAFIDICNALRILTDDAMQQRHKDEALDPPSVAIDTVLTKLEDYARSHFSWEWAEMSRISDVLAGGPHAEAFVVHMDKHVAEHTAFKRYIDVFRQQHAKNVVSIMSAHVFSRHWLTTHIATVDKELSYWYRVAHGLPPRPSPA